MKLQINDLVVVSHEPDATMYRVKEVKGFLIGIIDAEIEDTVTNQAIRYIDKSLLKTPSRGQWDKFQTF